MKHLQILLLSILFATVSNASMLLDKQTPVCIEDFYQAGSSLYYLQSSNNQWYSTTENYAASYIIQGFKYDSSNGRCVPDPYLLLGMDLKDFNFLMAAIGLLFGAVFMFFSVKLFESVGGKK